MFAEKKNKAKIVKSLVMAGAICFASMAALPLQSGPAYANAKDDAIRAISEHFQSVPTMTGEFIQFSPDGTQTGGKFYLQRPGKIRFNYDKPSTVQVISNGRTVAVNNSKLKTWNFYPLNKTPLKLLLDKKINIKNGSIRSVKPGKDITTVVMGDKQFFGNSEITLLFDPQSYDLRQWTIKDQQGKETSVMIFNVKKNVKIPTKYFVVDKQGILNSRTGRHR